MNFTNTDCVGHEVHTQVEMRWWLNEVRPEYKYLYKQVLDQMRELFFNQIFPIRNKITQGLRNEFH